MNKSDDDQQKKRKEVRIEPLSSDLSPATTPIHTNPEEDLASIRATIDALQKDDVPTTVEDATPVQQYVVQPAQQAAAPFQQQNGPHSSAAASLIRRKLSRLYAKEPDTLEEAIDAFAAGPARSKHQQYMYNLSISGKSLADIQTAWHTYYLQLPDAQKHEVWQEFYSAHEAQPTHHTQHAAPSHHATKHKAAHHTALGTTHTEQKTVAELKGSVLQKVSGGGKLSAKHHIQSLLFGFGIASICAALFLFSFFNERFIAPFISPSKQVSATPIVGSGTSVGPEPKIVIPKINVEVPVVYGLPDVNEKSIQNALESGVVHYSTSPTPGQVGNTVIVGHSSNNILNKGKYKFAFVLLKRLEVGDTFSMHKDGVRYTYQIFEKKIVKPTDVGVLGASSRPNTATLITCDPPGTSLNRLIVVAEQISPDPSGNAIVEQKAPTLTNTGVLPSNAPSLWQRIKNFFN